MLEVANDGGHGEGSLQQGLAIIAWIIKNGPATLRPDLVAALRRKADLVFRNNPAESSVAEQVPAESTTIVLCVIGHLGGNEHPSPVARRARRQPG